jgi:hemerythrin-like domain-containing protein
MRSATDILREEHGLILHALGSLEQAADRLASGAAPPDGFWDDLIAWLRAFADANHHGKEEGALFPAIVNAGVLGRGGPIEVMLEEHAEGRRLLRAMETGPARERAIASRRYVGLLRDHIGKENEVLFPLADAVLDDDAQAALLRQFARVGAGPDAVLAGAEQDVARFADALNAPARPEPATR